MKNLLAVVSLLLLTLSCQLPVQNLRQPTNHDRSVGSLHLKFGTALPARTVRPQLGSLSGLVDTVSVTFSSNSGFVSKGPYTVDLDNESEHTFEGLEPGSWNVDLVAHFPTLSGVNNTTRPLVLMNKTVTAASVLSVDVSIVDFLATGTGSLSLEVNVPVDIDYISGEVRDADTDALIDTPLTPSIVGGGATLFKSGLPSGIYDLILTLKRGGAGGTVAGVFRESVNVWEGQVANKWVSPDDGSLLASRTFDSTELFSENAELSDLVLRSGGTPLDSQDYTFSSATLNYGPLWGDLAIETLTLDAEYSLDGQKVDYKLNGGTWTLLEDQAESSTLTMITGVNTVLVRVTAPNRVTSKTYTITVHYQVDYVSTGFQSVLIDGPTSTTAGSPVATFTGVSAYTPTSSAWLVDGKVVQTNAGSTITDLSYDTTNAVAGLHQVQLEVTLSGGAKYTSAASPFLVRDLHTTRVVHSVWQWVQQGYMVAYIRPDGTLWSNGLNNYGQLGDGTTVNRSVPTYITNDVIDVAVSEIWAAFVKADGSLWVSGLNTSGQFGDGSATTTEYHSPHAVSTMASGVVEVSAEGNTLFVLKADGTLWGSGYNGDKNLGIPGDTADRLTFVQVAQAAGTLSRLYTASEEAYAINTQGELWVSGHNNWGSLGLGTTTTPNGWTKVTLPFATSIAEITGGRNQAAIRTTDGKVWVAGNNNGGQLGLTYQNTGQSDAFKTFTLIPGLADAVSVAIGQGPGVGFNQSFISIAKSDGTVVAAGLNGSGAFGDGTVIPNPYYRIGLGLVTGMSQVARVFGGVDVTTFLKTDGSLWAAGGNDYNVGNNGTGNTFLESFPVKVTFGPQPLKIFAGGMSTFVIKPDGSVWAAGRNDSGQLGDSTTNDQTTFVNVMSGSTFASVATGPTWHTLFLKTDGSVWAVGDDTYGQLGDGAFATRTTPFPVSGFGAGTAKAVVVGSALSLILGTDGKVYAAGLNDGGQLGQGDLTNRSNFTAVSGLTGVVAIAAGPSYSMVLKADGTLWTAGVEPGSFRNQLGLTSGYPTLASYMASGETSWAGQKTFVQVLSGVRQIAAGDRFSMAVKDDGSLWVAGDNDDGQLGLGTTVTAYDGYVKAINKGVSGVAAGGTHALVLMNNRTLWGMGSSYQVAQSSFQTLPVLIDSGVQALGAGGLHTFFQRQDGSLYWVGTDNWDANGISSGQVSTSTPERVW